MFLTNVTHKYITSKPKYTRMGETKEIFIDVLQYIENKKFSSPKKIAVDLNLNENKVKPIIDIYLKYKFIDKSNNHQTYHITNVGKDYLNIKS